MSQSPPSEGHSPSEAVHPQTFQQPESEIHPLTSDRSRSHTMDPSPTSASVISVQSIQSLEREERRIRRGKLTAEEALKLRETRLRDVQDPESIIRQSRKISKSMSESPSTPLPPTSKNTNPTGTAETSKVVDQGGIKVMNERDVASDEEELSQTVLGIALESSEGRSHHPRWQTSSIVRPRDTSLQIPSTMDAAFTNADWDEVHRVFPDATMILYSYPFCVICGVTPPNEPVSVKGLITEFYDNIEEYSYLPCDCGNPLVPDPPRKKV